MNIPPSELIILTLLSRYGQATSSQLFELGFSLSKSRTSLDRPLKRLREMDYVEPAIQRRYMGGRDGGSGQYVWILSRKGWKLMGRSGLYRRFKMDYHELSVVDVAVRLNVTHQSGHLLVSELTVGRECRFVVHDIEIEPDLAATLRKPGTDQPLALFIEVDMSTEWHDTVIADKLTNYLRAYRLASASELPVLRRVVFVTLDDARRDQIDRLIKRLPDGTNGTSDDQRRFKAISYSDFPIGLSLSIPQ